MLPNARLGFDHEQILMRNQEKKADYLRIFRQIADLVNAQILQKVHLASKALCWRRWVCNERRWWSSPSDKGNKMSSRHTDRYVRVYMCVRIVSVFGGGLSFVDPHTGRSLSYRSTVVMIPFFWLQKNACLAVVFKDKYGGCTDL